MKTSATLMLALSATITDAASLRSRATTRMLSDDQVASIDKIASKYDCHAAQGDLVQTLQNIVTKNDLEGTRLSSECTGFLTANELKWETAKAKFINDNEAAETKYSDAKLAAKEKDEYDVNAAKDTHDSAKLAAKETHEAAQLAAKDKYETARSAAKDKYDTEYPLVTTNANAIFDSVEAIWSVDGDLGSKIKAVETPWKEAEDASTTADGFHENAMSEKIKEIGDAEDAHTTSQGVCTTLKNDRAAHISSDVALLEKMEPLLKQLNICEDGTTAQDGKANEKLLSLLEVSTNTKCALAKKSLMSLLEVSGVPTGSYADFKARVETETAHMNTQKTDCDAKADADYAAIDKKYTDLETVAREDAKNKKVIFDNKKKEYDDEVIVGTDKMAAAETARATAIEEGQAAKTATRDQTYAEADDEKFASDTDSGDTRDQADKKADDEKEASDKDIQDTRDQADKKADDEKEESDTNIANEKSNSKSSIEADAAQQEEYCTEGKDNLVAEAALVRQMNSILNTGGDEGSDLRVVGDEEVGNAVTHHAATDTWYCVAKAKQTGYKVNKNDYVIAKQTWSLDDAHTALGPSTYGKNTAIIPMVGQNHGDPHALSKSGSGFGMWWNNWHTIHAMQDKCDDTIFAAKAGDTEITGEDAMTEASDFGTVSEDLKAVTFASLVPMTGTFTSNSGRKWYDQTPFIVSASTYVFGGYDGGWFKMASVDADGKFIENRHTKSCSVIADLTSTIWEAANRGGRYSVTNIKMSSVGGQWNSQEDDVLP